MHTLLLAPRATTEVVRLTCFGALHSLIETTKDPYARNSHIRFPELIETCSFK